MPASFECIVQAILPRGFPCSTLFMHLVQVGQADESHCSAGEKLQSDLRAISWSVREAFSVLRSPSNSAQSLNWVVILLRTGDGFKSSSIHFERIKKRSARPSCYRIAEFQCLFRVASEIRLEIAFAEQFASKTAAPLCLFTRPSSSSRAFAVEAG